MVVGVDVVGTRVGQSIRLIVCAQPATRRYPPAGLRLERIVAGSGVVGFRSPGRRNGDQGREREERRSLEGSVEVVVEEEESSERGGLCGCCTGRGRDPE